MDIATATFVINIIAGITCTIVGANTNAGYIMANVAMVAAVCSVAACAVKQLCLEIPKALAVLRAKPGVFIMVRCASFNAALIILWPAIVTWIVLAECRTAMPLLNTWLPKLALTLTIVEALLFIIWFVMKRLTTSSKR